MTARVWNANAGAVVTTAEAGRADEFCSRDALIRVLTSIQKASPTRA